MLKNNLGASLGIYKTLIEKLPVCVKLVDTSGKLLSINSYGKDEHFLKNKRQEEVQKWNYFDSVNLEYRKKIKEALKLAQSGKSTSFEIEHIPKHSKNRFCYAIFIPVKERNKTVREIFFISTDITKRKQAEEKERELNNLRHEFINIISHQFRTPLNSIRWGVEAILSGDLGKLSEEQRDFIKKSIYDANGNIIYRLNDMLEVVDIEEGRVKLTKSKILLGDFWTNVMKDWKDKCAAKGVVLYNENLTKESLYLRVDPDKILKVFEELLRNACDYTPKGGKIFTKITQEDGRVRVVIKDTGIGIPKNEQSHIFTKFFRTPNASKAEPNASGIGLVIAKKIVEKHGGQLGFTSKENKGSVFWFTIPIN